MSKSADSEPKLSYATEHTQAWITMSTPYFVGIDVQTARGCACAVIDGDGKSCGTFWQDGDAQAVVAALRKFMTARHCTLSDVIVGIDSPRVPLSQPRRWYWEGSRKKWRERRASEAGHGRHCEIVLAAHDLANPQWTPIGDAAPAWMSLGFRLFALLDGQTVRHEVFPTASYAQFATNGPRIEVDLSNLAAGPKDMLDAYVAAVTVSEFTQGRGCEVGGMDGLGAIVLPRPIPKPISAVFQWPRG
jgi:hypothetical protein